MVKYKTTLLAIFIGYCKLLGTCGTCVDWKSEAGEIQTGETAYRLETAEWSPTLGFAVKDSLFPHVSGGLRGRTLTITSIQVYLHITRIIISYILNYLFCLSLMRVCLLAVFPMDNSGKRQCWSCSFIFWTCFCHAG